MMLQLNPPIYLETPKGPARAVVMIDMSEDHDLLWVCFLKVDGTCWTFRNQVVRQITNETFDRKTCAGA